MTPDPKARIAEPEAGNAALREQVDQLVARVEELQARLTKDSYNSGKPASAATDGWLGRQSAACIAPSSWSAGCLAQSAGSRPQAARTAGASAGRGARLPRATSPSPSAIPKPSATCAGSRSTRKSPAASAALLMLAPSPAEAAIRLPCASEARRCLPPAKRSAPASRSILTCYNSAWEKTGKLKTPFAPAIHARVGSSVYDQRRNLRWCCPRLARRLTEHPRV